MVLDETDLVVKRLNQAEATRAVLLQMAVSGLFSDKAGENFTKLIKTLSEE